VVSKKVLYNKYCSWPSGLMRRRQWKERKKRYHFVKKSTKMEKEVKSAK